MDRAAVEGWLERYGRAWETRDPGAAAELFTEDAEYREKPFDEPMTGRAAIYRYWSEIPETQRDIAFGFETLSVDGERAIVRWWASYVKIRNGEPTRLDGVFLLEFAEDGRCRSLREWWHAHPSPAFTARESLRPIPADPAAAQRSRAVVLAALIALGVAGALVFLLLR
ncbi:MAG: nuclear transport factor 2 family protein [Actinomycetota bacterium]